MIKKRQTAEEREKLLGYIAVKYNEGYKAGKQETAERIFGELENEFKSYRLSAIRLNNMKEGPKPNDEWYPVYEIFGLNYQELKARWVK